MAYHNDLSGHNTSLSRNNQISHTQPPSRRSTNPEAPSYEGINTT